MKRYKKRPDNAGTAYGDTVYWLTIAGSVIALAGTVAMFFWPVTGFDPAAMFTAIMAGESSEQIWQASTGNLPQGHWYLNNLKDGNALAMLGIVIPILASIPAMIWSAKRLLKRGSYFFGIQALLVAATLLVVALIQTS